MDLILLQPGDATLINPANSWQNGGSLLAPKSGTDGNLWQASDPVLAPSPGVQGTFAPGQFIELVSLHQGMKQQMTTDVSNSARTSGRPVISEFTCVKYVDKLSVKMFDLCLRAKPLGSGKDHPTMIYIMRNSGELTANIMTISLRDAMISEIQFQTNPDDMPTEQFKLNFTEILWAYTVQLTDTQIAGQVPAGWSLARNGPIGQFTA
jgi:type VI secretion system secreted protein Hcp